MVFLKARTSDTTEPFSFLPESIKARRHCPSAAFICNVLLPRRHVRGLVSGGGERSGSAGRCS